MLDLPGLRLLAVRLTARPTGGNRDRSVAAALSEGRGVWADLTANLAEFQASSLRNSQAEHAGVRVIHVCNAQK